MKSETKTKLTFQTIREGNKYTLIYLVDGAKHTKSFVCDDKKEASERLKKAQNLIRKHYENSDNT